MLIELHILQNFAPSNLNRDDTNAPKDCEFGGFRRARISSQCIKRAIRTEFSKSRLINDDHLSKRSRDLRDHIAGRFVENGKDETTATAVIELAIIAMGFNFKKNKTQYALFLARSEINKFVALVEEHWDKLKTESAKKEPKVPPKIQKAFESVLGAQDAIDLALFGRMLANVPQRNVDAASQVAHAISTNKVEMEFDFYTAVDDFQKPTDEPGADMMGTVEFNSSCFYRYANIDIDQLLTNLGGDRELVEQTIAAFVRASVAAIPTGKQNSMAAQNQPSFVLAVVRDSGLWSLANAFVKPVWPKRDDDLVTASISRIDSFWQQMAETYGESGIRDKAVLALSDDGLASLKESRVKADGGNSALDVLLDRILTANVNAATAEGGQA